MPSQVTLRVIVRHPVPGVTLRVQRGRGGLVPPIAETADAVTFELLVEARARPDGSVRVSGPEVQGPPAARFVYVNAGTYAGQANAPFGRRAKVPLGELTGGVVNAALARRGAVIVGEIDGRGRDGGPAAATVPLLGEGWRVVPRDA